jgi:hypothetical protein
MINKKNSCNITIIQSNKYWIEKHALNRSLGDLLVEDTQNKIKSLMLLLRTQSFICNCLSLYVNSLNAIAT